DMIRVMANENMEEWGATAAITEETIRSVVQAFGDGRIALSPNGRNAPKEGIRHAPSFCTGATLTPGVRVAKAYTAESIAAYLNWWESDGGDKEKGRPPGRRAHRRINFALEALEAEELDLLPREVEEILEDPEARENISLKTKRTIVGQA